MASIVSRLKKRFARSHFVVSGFKCLALVGVLGFQGLAHGQETALPPLPGSVTPDVDTPQAEPGFLDKLMEAPRQEPSTWASVDYLLWFTQSAPMPPMLTTGPMSELGPSGRPGVLGNPGTQTLIGGTMGFVPSSGVRVTGGIWLDEEQQFGLEGSYLLLPQQTNAYTYSGSGQIGSAPLSVPYFNAQIGAPDSTGVAVPGAFSGTATLWGASSFQTAEVNMLHRIGQWKNFSVDGLLGYRWGLLDEVMQYSTTSTNLDPSDSAEIQTTDRFHSQNSLYAGQIGLRLHRDYGRFALGGGVKLAMGSMVEVTKINGAAYTNLFTPDQIQAFPGGYFAQPTNQGYHRENRFAVMPELGFNGSVRLLDRVKLNMGYNFLFLSEVARPGDQISTTINPSQSNQSFSGTPPAPMIGQPAPLFTPISSQYFAHGFNFGLEFVW